jgi:putative membrane protein
MDRGYFAGLVGVLILEIAGVLIQVVTGRPVPEVTVPATAFVVACMLRDHGLRRTMTFVVLVLAIPFASEFLGVLTGIPYGPYAYTGMGGPWLFGLVPVFILVAWINIAYLTMATSTLAFGRSRLGLALIDGVLAVSWDAMVDPLAVRAGYWNWVGPGSLYGVPWTNFLGWFLVVALLSLAVRLLWSRGTSAPIQTSRVTAFIVPTLLLGSTASFAALAAAAGLWLSAGIGLAVLVPAVGAAWGRVLRIPAGVAAPTPWAPPVPTGRRAPQGEERT